ncbi:MAG: DUF2782 domain-containing protein [Magnetococcales bacterium]|nr:DUF2782 domain-containing protein [Magnetococcales bacterium]
MLFKKPSLNTGTLLAGLLLLVAASPSLAREDHAPPAKGPLVSELREKAEPDGPETVIRKYEDAQGNQVRESAVNGAVFQIQVIPYSGPPYYLIDNDGDGLFETRINGYEPKLMVPQWVLFRF